MGEAPEGRHALGRGLGTLPCPRPTYEIYYLVGDYTT